MKKYRKKPVVVEAFRWMIDVVPEWWKTLEGVHIEVHTGCALIPTLEGEMRAYPSDYIVQGIKGEVYPVKPDIFEATYEEVRIDEAKMVLR